MAARRRMLLVAALAALALHLLLWTRLIGRPPLDPGEAAARPVRLQLRLDVAQPGSSPAAPPALEARPAHPLEAIPPATARRAARPSQPGPTLDERSAAAEPPAGEPPAGVGTHPDAPATSALAPLDLRLPAAGPGRMLAPSTRSQALNDSRLGARPGADERFGLAFAGIAGRTEEQLGDGTIRIRSGTSCVLVHPVRAAALDPFNNAVRTAPRHVEAC